MGIFGALKTPDPLDKKKIDAIKEELPLNEEQKRLLEIGQANDFAALQETSATFSMLIGLGAILLALGANITQLIFQVPIDLEVLLYSALSMLAIIAVLMYTRRDMWRKNRPMERLCTSALGSLIFICLNRLVGLQYSMEPTAVIAVDCYSIGLGTLMVAQIVSYGYLIPCICIFFGSIATFYPALAMPCLSLITLIVPFGTWWAWKSK